MINVKITQLIRKLHNIKYCKRYFAGRLLALVTDPPPAHVEPVAFYAYMSKPEPAPVTITH